MPLNSLGLTSLVLVLSGSVLVQLLQFRQVQLLQG
jgi:hypothetical protein